MTQPTISFVTPGLLDIRALNTFGLSAKLTENPIGYFGTGLKYAIAVLLRTGHEVNLSSGGKQHKLRMADSEFRGASYKAIFLDDQPLPFTSELGKNWVPWMAFRELESNTRDERGETVEGELLFAADKTVLSVTGMEMFRAWQDRHLIFLSERRLLDLTSGELEVSSGPSKYVYYRGVRVAEPNYETMFTYNLTGNYTLTEDRTLFMVDWQLSNLVPRLTDKGVLQDILLAPIEFLEHHFDYSAVGTNESFLDAIESAAKSHAGQLSESAVRLFVKRKRILPASEKATLGEYEQAMLLSAKAFCAAIGYPLDEFEIETVKSLGEAVKAVAEMKTKRIRLASNAFHNGLRDLVHTLLHEYTHLKYDVPDASRMMEEKLLDMLITVGERFALKRPL